MSEPTSDVRGLLHLWQEAAPVPSPFLLVRRVDETGISGTSVVAHGVEFADGRVEMRWRTGTPSTAAYDCIDHVEEIHGHGGSTTVQRLPLTDLVSTVAAVLDVADRGWDASHCPGGYSHGYQAAMATIRNIIVDRLQPPAAPATPAAADPAAPDASGGHR